MRYGGYGYGMMGDGFGLIMMIVFLVIVVLGVMAFFRYLHHHSGPMSRNGASGSTSTNNALDILNERFARGEIDEEEYKKKKEHLKV